MGVTRQCVVGHRAVVGAGYRRRLLATARARALRLAQGRVVSAHVVPRLGAGKGAGGGDAAEPALASRRLTLNLMPRNALESVSGRAFLLQRQIAEGNDADKPLVAAQNRQPPHLQL